MAHGRRLPDETYNAIVADLESGLRAAAIVKKRGVSRPTVYRIDRDRLAGVKRAPSPKPDHTHGLGEERYARLLAELTENHLSSFDLGVKYGLSESTVNTVLRKSRVERSGPRSRESPVLLAAGDWVYGKDGVARWDKTATPRPITPDTYTANSQE